MDFTEKTLSSKPIFSGRIIDVSVDTVLLPDGSQSTREIVRHAEAVAIVAMDDKQNIYLGYYDNNSNKNFHLISQGFPLRQHYLLYLVH